MKRSMGTAALLAVLCLAFGAVSAAPAEALDVDPGAGFGQTDIRLNSDETRRAATDPAMAWWYCSNSVVESPGMANYFGFACAMALNASGANALRQGKKAGVTVMPWGSWWYWIH